VKIYFSTRLLSLSCAMVFAAGCAADDAMADADTGDVDIVDVFVDDGAAAEEVGEAAEALKVNSDVTVQLRTVGPIGSGSRYYVTCDKGQVVTGVDTEWYSTIGRLRMKCGKLSPITNTPYGNFPGPWIGGRSLVDFYSKSTTCAGGRTMVGFDGRAGARLDSLSIACALASRAFSTSSGRVSADQILPAGGGTGGNPTDTPMCPAKHVMTGIYGYASTGAAQVYSIGGICSPLVR
jgi:hypothetical protein